MKIRWILIDYIPSAHGEYTSEHRPIRPQRENPLLHRAKGQYIHGVHVYSIIHKDSREKNSAYHVILVLNRPVRN